MNADHKVGPSDWQNTEYKIQIPVSTKCERTIVVEAKYKKKIILYFVHH